MSIRGIVAASLALLAVIVLAGSGSAVDASPPLRTYRVTLTNLTHGQPFSPGVAVTHNGSTNVFEVGELASNGIEAIAEDGNEAPAVAEVTGAPGVTDVHDIARPLTPSGRTVGPFTDTITFEIMAHPRDRLSLAVMLICTNDGFTGLDGAKLPARGSVTYGAASYDAGTENNTEQSSDIVDPCSALGPVHLPGDPDGNNDATVDTNPHVPIHHHPGIAGTGELTVSDHGWTDPVASVKIERIDPPHGDRDGRENEETR